MNIWFLVAFLAGSSPALAACDGAFTPAQFDALVKKASDAIGNDDVVAHGTVLRELKGKLPCLEGQIPKERWADFLVGMAVVEYALGRSWQGPLATAMRIHPSVDRDYGPDPLKTFPGSELARTDAALDAGRGLYFLDGVPLIGHAPSLVGLHVAQRFDGSQWETRVLEDAPFPAEWTLAAAPVPAPATVPSPLPEPETVAVPAPEPAPEPVPPDLHGKPPYPPVTVGAGGAVLVYPRYDVGRVLFGSGLSVALRLARTTGFAADAGAWTGWAPLADGQVAFLPMFRLGARASVLPASAKGDLYLGAVATVVLSALEGAELGGSSIMGGYYRLGSGPLGLGGEIEVGWNGVLHAAPVLGAFVAPRPRAKVAEVAGPESPP